MTTLMKRKRRHGLAPLENRLLTPWSHSALSPWGSRLFGSIPNGIRRYDDIFDDDFFEEDSLMPAMNVKEHNDDFEIEFAAPGFSKKDFEVFIEDDVLHVSGEKELEEEQNEDDFSSKEFSYKSFKRSLTLPPAVDLSQDVKALYVNGILTLKLLKKEEVIEKETPKKVIEVK